ncbi:type II toxin-antitoxin system HicB family antitoxin [bacterium]|nr:type II toxin-antitoxin system HicB family antitoxin [bacterium]
MSVKLTATIWQEGNQYVSLCPELGVSSFGPDPKEALIMLREAVELYLLNAKEEDTLEDLTEILTSPIRFQTTFEVEVA